MTIGRNKRAVGTFATYRDAEAALYELRDSGFPMDRISVVGRDVDRHDEIAGASASDRVSTSSKQVAHDTEADEGAKKGAIAGGALGGLTGLLVGLGALAIPGIGPVMLGGAAATALATTLSGGAIGAAAGGLVGGLVGLGIPEDRARVYNDRVSRGEYLVMVEGSEDEIRRAQAVLGNRGIQEWGVYDYDADRVHTTSTVGTTTVGTPTDRTDFPAGTLYPDNMPYEDQVGGRSERNDFPAGTLYPDNKPYEDQVRDQRDTL